MAKINKFLDTRNKKATKFPLKIQISHKSKRRYIPTGYYLTEKDWDPAKEKIRRSFDKSTRANIQVDRKYNIVEEVIERLNPTINTMSVDEIKHIAEQKIDEEFSDRIKKDPLILEGTNLDQTCFYNYAKKVIGSFYETDRAGSAQTIENAVDSLKKFTSRDILPFTDITKEFLKSYELWYLSQFNKKGKRNSVNGLGFYMRDIRRVFNLAIKDESTTLQEKHYPFGRYGYSIKKEKTENRDVDAADIARIFQLQLTPETKLWHHHNYFKFYFECWGMNFADIAYLRVYQVQDGRLKYRRRKTRWANDSKTFDIELSDIAKEIIEYYAKGKSSQDLVFPILEDVIDCGNSKLLQKKFHNKRSNHIRRLKAIGEKAGVDSKLTTYIARHSFFSIALQGGVSKSSISELAGHSNYQITETYLSGFKNEQLTSNAEMVRKAVGKHLSPKENEVLNESIEIKSNGQTLPVGDYLSNLNENDPQKLLISLLTHTTCQNGAKAQEYVDVFIA